MIVMISLRMKVVRRKYACLPYNWYTKNKILRNPLITMGHILCAVWHESIRNNMDWKSGFQSARDEKIHGNRARVKINRHGEENSR
jgi:hypothetical protein